MWITFPILGDAAKRDSVLRRLSELGWSPRWLEGSNFALLNGVSINEDKNERKNEVAWTGQAACRNLLEGREAYRHESERGMHALGDLEALMNTDKYKYPIVPEVERYVPGRCVPLF